SCSAQCCESVPAIWSEVEYSPSSFSRMPESRGSTSARNCSGGKPPHLRLQSHLWPMAQILRFTSLGSVMPQRVAATMSQCSRAETSSERLEGLWRSQWRSFENPHSEEYTPPHQLIASNPCRRAACVISAASPFAR